MRKLALYLVFASAVTFAACQSDNQTNTEATETHEDSVNRENVLDEADKMLNDTTQNTPSDTISPK